MDGNKDKGLELSALGKYRFFDVTADVGYWAYGENINTAFENGSTAMFEVITSTKDIEDNFSEEFSIDSEDLESLLYDYLEELLYRHEVNFRLYNKFQIKIKPSTEGYHLDAHIEGDNINWDKYERRGEIKAITFHQMKIETRTPSKIRVILDI